MKMLCYAAKAVRLQQRLHMGAQCQQLLLQVVLEGKDKQHMWSVRLRNLLFFCPVVSSHHTYNITIKAELS